ncbi:MAG: terminase small subunit [Liquorilactobacillus sp.]|uniref:terminase small subunit n=1 Tax=Liquorilactobacillus sp. TaxID=2767923 RepID=UPI0039E9E494
MKLNKKQKKFADLWMKTHNAYQSALKANYSKSYAKNATKYLLENHGIQEYIRKRTEKVEKKEDSEVDEVLTNIYRIAAGKPIKRDFVQIDNIKKEIDLRGVSKDTKPMAELRADYEVNETTLTPAATKEQVAAAELWFKLKGQLKNESKEVEEQKVRKLKSDADLAEAKAKQAKENGTELVQPINIIDRWGSDSDDAND